eukprot:TRINITY_DN936_c0_g3_i1.p1 TRINITY_DN936_c0_g3~~TRINITY_DN936_c0_g3_i1.p1  ORF type:complete len:1995 (+),score=509.29 TRINITY_DN936_c0_g3_i1:58-6042(+)
MPSPHRRQRCSTAPRGSVSQPATMTPTVHPTSRLPSSRIAAARRAAWRGLWSSAGPVFAAAFLALGGRREAAEWAPAAAFAVAAVLSAAAAALPDHTESSSPSPLHSVRPLSTAARALLLLLPVAPLARGLCAGGAPSGGPHHLAAYFALAAQCAWMLTSAARTPLRWAPLAVLVAEGCLAAALAFARCGAAEGLDAVCISVGAPLCAVYGTAAACPGAPAATGADSVAQSRAQTPGLEVHTIDRAAPYRRGCSASDLVMSYTPDPDIPELPFAVNDIPGLVTSASTTLHAGSYTPRGGHGTPRSGRTSPRIHHCKDDSLMSPKSPPGPPTPPSPPPSGTPQPPDGRGPRSVHFGQAGGRVSPRGTGPDRRQRTLSGGPRMRQPGPRRNSAPRGSIDSTAEGGDEALQHALEHSRTSLASNHSAHRVSRKDSRGSTASRGSAGRRSHAQHRGSEPRLRWTPPQERLRGEKPVSPFVEMLRPLHSVQQEFGLTDGRRRRQSAPAVHRGVRLPLNIPTPELNVPTQTHSASSSPIPAALGAPAPGSAGVGTVAPLELDGPRPSSPSRRKSSVREGLQDALQRHVGVPRDTSLSHIMANRGSRDPLPRNSSLPRVMGIAAPEAHEACPLCKRGGRQSASQGVHHGLQRNASLSDKQGLPQNASVQEWLQERRRSSGESVGGDPFAARPKLPSSLQRAQQGGRVSPEEYNMDDLHRGAPSPVARKGSLRSMLPATRVRVGGSAVESDSGAPVLGAARRESVAGGLPRRESVLGGLPRRESVLGMARRESVAVAGLGPGSPRRARARAASDFAHAAEDPSEREGRNSLEDLLGGAPASAKPGGPATESPRGRRVSVAAIVAPAKEDRDDKEKDEKLLAPVVSILDGLSSCLSNVARGEEDPGGGDQADENEPQEMGVQQLKVLWEYIGSSDQGTLDLEGCQEVLTAFGVEMSDEDWEDFIDEIDVNGDGLIDFEEFARTFTSFHRDQRFANVAGAISIAARVAATQGGWAQRKALEIWEKHDSDQSGTLEREEIQLLCKEMGLPHSDLEIGELMQELDEDGDGTIDFAEFMALFKLPGQQQEQEDALQDDPLLREASKAFATEELSGYSTPLQRSQERAVARRDRILHVLVQLVFLHALTNFVVPLYLVCFGAQPPVGYRIFFLCFDSILYVWIYCMMTLPADTGRGVTVYDPKQIRMLYFTSVDFAVDLIVALPLDFIGLWVTYDGVIMHPIFRLNKTLHVLHLEDLFHRVAQHWVPSPTLRRIGSAFYWWLLTSHLFACFFSVVAQYEGDKATEVVLGTIPDFSKMELWPQYVQAFDWALKTMSGLSRGLFPAEDRQVVLVLTTVVFGVMVYALILSTVGAATQMETSESKFRDKIDTVQSALRYQRLPPDFRDECIQFYRFVFQTVGQVEEDPEVLSDLPLHLELRVTYAIGMRVVGRVPVFASGVAADKLLLVALAVRLQSSVQPPGARLTMKGDLGDCMFFLTAGECVVIDQRGNEIQRLQAGSFFGEIALLHDVRRTATVVCSRMCNMLTLDRDAFEEVMTSFPDALEALRKASEARILDLVERDRSERRRRRSERRRMRAGSGAAGTAEGAGSRGGLEDAADAAEEEDEGDEDDDSEASTASAAAPAPSPSGSFSGTRGLGSAERFGSGCSARRAESGRLQQAGEPGGAPRKSIGDELAQRVNSMPQLVTDSDATQAGPGAPVLLGIQRPRPSAIDVMADRVGSGFNDSIASPLSLQPSVVLTDSSPRHGDGTERRASEQVRQDGDGDPDAASGAMARWLSKQQEDNQRLRKAARTGMLAGAAGAMSPQGRRRTFAGAGASELLSSPTSEASSPSAGARQRSPSCRGRSGQRRRRGSSIRPGQQAPADLAGAAQQVIQQQSPTAAAGPAMLSVVQQVRAQPVAGEPGAQPLPVSDVVQQAQAAAAAAPHHMAAPAVLSVLQLGSTDRSAAQGGAGDAAGVLGPLQQSASEESVIVNTVSQEFGPDADDRAHG